MLSFSPSGIDAASNSGPWWRCTGRRGQGGGMHLSSPFSAQPGGQHCAEAREEGHRAEHRVRLHGPRHICFPSLLVCAPMTPQPSSSGVCLCVTDSQGPGHTWDCSPSLAVCRLRHLGAHRQHRGPVPVPSSVWPGWGSPRSVASQHAYRLCQLMAHVLEVPWLSALELEVDLPSEG